MAAEHLLAFNLALLAAILSPGPAFLVAVQTTLTAGRRAGIAAGLGLGTMAALWTLAALLGLERMFALFPWAYGAAKTAGALYLLYLAWGIWRGADAPLTGRPGVAARRAFWRGVTVNALNPKSVLFAAAVLVVIFPPGLRVGEIALIWANHLVIEWAFYTAAALLIGNGAARARYLALKSVFDRVTAAVLGAVGLRMLLDRAP